MPFGLWSWMGPEESCKMGIQIRHRKGQFWGKGAPIVWYRDFLSIETFCHDLCKNGCTDQFAVWVVDSGGPKEAEVTSYSPGGASVRSWDGTLEPPEPSVAAIQLYVRLLWLLVVAAAAVALNTQWWFCIELSWIGAYGSRRMCSCKCAFYGAFVRCSL